MLPEKGQGALPIPFIPVIAVVFLYLAYRWALPKPIPGIPYDESARRNILGNLPELRAYLKKNGRLRPWIVNHPARHKSPITQFWARPFARPSIILSDFQETQDILLRRTKEFDRGQRSVDFFKGVIGNHHIAMKSNDPRFKGNKELVKDLMAPAFLNEVSAPEIYAKAMSLVELWTVKTQLAGGRPFDVHKDIFDAAIDIINAASFGLDDDLSTVKHQLNSLTSLSDGAELPVNADGSVQFTHPPDVPEIAAIHQISLHIGATFKSQWPLFAHYYRLWTSPSLMKAIRLKDKLIHDEIEKSVARFRSGNERTRSAMDHILQREMNAAKKAGRPPVFHSARIRDELFGYIVGGHDTSATALRWMIKWLADDQAAQCKLHAALRAAYARAAAEKRQPSVAELAKTSVPYLDAFLEEALRVNAPVPFTMRDTTVDTTLLGRRVPRGTSVFFAMEGPGYLMPGIPIPAADDGARSDTSRAAAAKGRCHGAWDPEDIACFRPERWLKTAAPKDGGEGEGDGDGEVYFDPQAGPMLTFSLGPRGCFGRRLAYLETRLVLALLVWNFEFRKLPGELGSRAVVDGITAAPQKCFVALTKLP